MRMKVTLVAALVAVSLAGCGDQRPTLFVEVLPTDAVLTIDGWQHPGGSPHDLVLKQAGRFTLRIAAPGHLPVDQLVTLAPGERRTLSVELVPQIAPAPIPAATSASPTTSSVADGELSISTLPMSVISLDGEKLGPSPLVKRRVPAGAHKLVMVSAARDARREIEVVIKPGEHLKLRETL